MNQTYNDSDILTEDEIRAVYSEQGKFEVMMDGIINEDEFKNAERKILWLMKEPFGALPEHVRCGIPERVSGFKNDSFHTWNRIALASYRILKCTTDLSQQPSWNVYGKSLNQISIINLKKTAGKSTTRMNVLSKYFKNNGDPCYANIILRQIDLIKPDIVIGAKTLDIFKPYLKNTKDLERGHFKCDKTIFINTLHPGQRKLSALVYANSIGSRIKQFEKALGAIC